MDIITQQRNELIGLLVGMFDAAPTADLLTEFVNAIKAGQSLSGLADGLTSSSEFQSLYPETLTHEEFATRFVHNLLSSDTNGDAVNIGIEFVLGLLNSGATLGETLDTSIGALLAVNDENPSFGQAKQILLNKIDLAAYYASTDLDAVFDFMAMRAMMDGISANRASLSLQKVLIDSGEVSYFSLNFLTKAQDSIVGSDGNDVFAAWVFDNQNTAQSGDIIRAGAGVDILMAKIVSVAEGAIALNADSLEAVYIQPQPVSSNTITDVVTFDASAMQKTVELWSTDALADLTVEHIQGSTDSVTLGWRNTEAGELNFTAYFDNIPTPPQIDESDAPSQIFIEILDVDGIREDGEPLRDNFFVGMQIVIDGAEVILKSPSGNPEYTYEDLIDGWNKTLAAKGIETVAAALGESFNVVSSSDGLAYEGTTIVLTNTGPEILRGVGWVTDVLSPSNIHTSIREPQNSGNDDGVTQVNVVFDGVGHGAKAGSFIAGVAPENSLSEESAKGIQKFNIAVDRDSWLDNVSSTHGSLEDIAVSNIGAAGSLRIDYLEDVKLFDARGMSNSVTLNAVINADRYDTDTLYVDGLAYFGGTGDDHYTLMLPAVAREDEYLNLDIDMGEGDDLLVLSFTSSVDDYKYPRSLNSRDVVVAGEGDDVITTVGGGAVYVDTGSGSDTVYSGTAGSDAARASWIFSAKTEVQPAGTLTIAFSPTASVDAEAFNNGFETTFTILSGSLLGELTSVNQIIKGVIEADNTLNKLLQATVNPDQSLTVSALIDGELQIEDLVMTIIADEKGSVTQAHENVQLIQAGVTSGEAASGSEISIRSGHDVVVLSTHADSTEVIELRPMYGSTIDADIVNFTTGDSQGADQLNISGFSYDAERRVTHASVLDSTVASDNEIIIFNDFVGDATQGETFEELTIELLLEALNSNNNGEQDYGNLGSQTLDADEDIHNLSDSYLIMVQNDTNKGEYKLFELSSSRLPGRGPDSDFNHGSLIGVVDLGAEAVFVAGNFV